MRMGRVMAAAGAMFVAAGCGGGGSSGDPAEPAMFGEWSPGGQLGHDSGQELYQPWWSSGVRHLKIDEDGTGSVDMWNFSLGAFDHLDLQWQRSIEGRVTLLIESRSDAPSYSVRFPDEQTLDLHDDAANRSFLFWRDDLYESPIETASLSPRELPLTSPIHPMTELVAMGTTSWFEIYGHTLVGEDGTLAPVDAIHSHPIAAQSGDFWLACAPCATPGKIERRTLGNALVSELDLSARIQTAITSGYFDGASMWIANNTTEPNDSDEHTEIWRFDPASGEDLGHFDVRAMLESFTFHEGRMFAIVRIPTQVLVEIDSQQQVAIRSFELPDDVRWQGLASIGGELEILGAGLNEYPVIATVENP